MDYTYLADYNGFLMQLAREQSDMNICIEEALILTEGVNVVPRFQTLHEGVGDKIKEVWNKFIGFIKRIFAKFKESMTKLLDNDKGWLEKYKDTILKKPYKLEGVKCRDYKLDRIAAVHVDLFNYSSLSSVLTSKAEYMKHYFNGSFGDKDNTDDLSGWCKNFFCGGSEEAIDFKTPNMTDLYNYCHDWKDKTLPDLEKDESNITKSANNAQTLINNAIKNANDATAQAEKDKADAEAEKNKGANTGEGNNGGQPPAEPAKGTDGAGTIKTTSPEESVLLYSKLYSKVLREENASIPSQKTATQTTSTAANTGDADKKFSNNAAGTNGDGETAQSAQAVAQTGISTDDVTNVLKTYQDVTSAITASKITVAGWAYNDYMKIIRAHVKMYVGDSDTADTVASNASNYKPPVGAPENPKDGETYKDPSGKVWQFLNSLGRWNPFKKK